MLMPNLPPATTRLIAALQKVGIDPILYGSQGVSVYLGAFKQFGDIDLLIESRWLGADWQHTASLEDALEIFTVNDTTIRTLKPQLFKKAYEFSVRDGYRTAVRGKKDTDVIARLNDYLTQGTEPAD